MQGEMADLSSVPRLIVKVHYPSVCQVFEATLEALLKQLVEDVAAYQCTLQASCKDSATQTLVRSAVNYLTGGPDTPVSFCKTCVDADGKMELLHSLLIELWTNNDGNLFPHLIQKIKKDVETHIKATDGHTMIVLPPVVVVFKTAADYCV